MSQVKVRPMGATATLNRNGHGNVVARSGANLMLAISGGAKLGHGSGGIVPLRAA